jgi:hypothetical protein
MFERIVLSKHQMEAQIHGNNEFWETLQRVSNIFSHSYDIIFH